MYFIKGKSVFQDRATQDAPNSDRVATKPYLRQFWGSALTASNASVLTLAISARKKALYLEYRKAQQDMRELVAVKGSVDHLRGLMDNQRNKEQTR